MHLFLLPICGGGKDVTEFIYHLTWPPWLEEAGKVNEREGGEKVGEREKGERKENKKEGNRMKEGSEKRKK